jgi:hypothetical protein
MKYGLDFSLVDGVMLQWYSGTGMDVCGTELGSNCLTKPDQCDPTDFKDKLNNKSPARCCGDDSLMGKLWATDIGNTYGISKTSDSLIPGTVYDQNVLSGDWAMPKGTQKCPHKCPRKADCPDWLYTGSKAYDEQLKLLEDLNTIPNLDISKKIVIGLEAFPNFTDKYKADGGRNVSYASQNWGPLPSAYAVVGLDNAVRDRIPTSKGIGGIGVYTANTAFTKTDIQRGGNDSIYHKLKTWKIDSWK